jgi:hypothetical protein
MMGVTAAGHRAELTTPSVAPWRARVRPVTWQGRCYAQTIDCAVLIVPVGEDHPLSDPKAGFVDDVAVAAW